MTTLYITQAKLYEDLDLALCLFKQGLSKLKKGILPTVEEMAYLNEKAHPVLKGLNSKFLKLYPLASPSIQDGTLFRTIWSEYVDTILYITRLDEALKASIAVLDYFRYRNDWNLSLVLVKWTNALNPQLSAVIVLELSGMMRLYCSDTRISVQILFNINRLKSLPIPIKELLSHEIELIKKAQTWPSTKSNAWQIKRTKVKVDFRICHIANGPDEQIFIGGFELDYSHGGIALADLQNGNITPIHSDIAVRSLFYDTSTHKLYVSAWQGKECKSPHIAVIKDSGEIEQIIDLCILLKRTRIQPACIHKVCDNLYFLDMVNRVVYEIHLPSLSIKPILGPDDIAGGRLQGMTGDKNDLLLFISHQLGFNRFNPKTGRLHNKEGKKLHGQITRICHDRKSGYTYTMGSETAIFEQSNICKPGRIIVLNMLNSEGDVIFCQHLYAEYCMDMTLFSDSKNQRLLLPGSDCLISVKLPEKR